ncbi:unnamed protein product, partial [Medioppia subpectinata]
MRSVPPLPPRRTISMAGQSSARMASTSDARLLQSVPPPPNSSNKNLMNFRFTSQNLDFNQNHNQFDSQLSRHTIGGFFANPVSTPTTTPTPIASTNQSYIQWQNQSLPPNSLLLSSPRPQMWSTLSTNNNSTAFANYVYSSSSAGVSPVSPLGVTPMTPLSHSLSAPSFSANAFSNTTYSYSYSPVFQSMTSNATTNVATTEDIKRLVTNGNQKNSSTIVSSRESKANNSDLIDLVDNEGQDILEMFDPLSRQENNDLNFSNNFELDSDPLGVTPMTPLSHSLSAPSFSANAFSNTTYSYSYSPVFQSMTSNATTNVATTEDIKRLVTNGNQKNSSTIVSSRESKANNSDLIDLVDNEGQDILEMFDPLSRQENNDLNFSNNFELDSESSAQETNKPEAESIMKTETNEIKAEEQPKELIPNSNDIHQPFRVVSRKCRANEELDNFFKQLVVLRRQYRHDDYIANSGLVISPTLDAQHDKSLSVKLVIETQLSPQPVSFTCNVDTSVEHIICHVICTLVEDASNVKMDDYLLKVYGLTEYLASDSVLANYSYVHQCHKFDNDVHLSLAQVKMDDYLLKVYGLTEYLASDSVLANYSYVHQCHKFDNDVHLSLAQVKDLKRPFARTLRDDNNIDFTVDEIIPKSIVCKFGELSSETINILLESFDREISKLRADARMSGSGQLQPQSIIQTVKALCAHLSTLETTAITESATNFSQLCNAFGTYKRDSITAIDDNASDVKMKSIPDLDSKLWEILDHALLKLRASLIQLIRLYSQTFPVEFDISDDLLHNDKRKVRKDISSSMDTLLCQVGVCCQLQPEWLTTFKEFK